MIREGETEEEYIMRMAEIMWKDVPQIIEWEHHFMQEKALWAIRQTMSGKKRKALEEYIRGQKEKRRLEIQIIGKIN